MSLAFRIVVRKPQVDLTGAIHSSQSARLCPKILDLFFKTNCDRRKPLQSILSHFLSLLTGLFIFVGLPLLGRDIRARPRFSENMPTEFNSPTFSAAEPV